MSENLTTLLRSKTRTIEINRNLPTAIIGERINPTVRKAVLEASNISFGMLDRTYINATYIAMAFHAGLTCPITNPLQVEVHTAVLAADLSMGRDEYGLGWNKADRKREKGKVAP